MISTRLFKPTIYITLFAILGQVIMFFTQMLNASYFGSSYKMDAFIAANTIPYYLITVFSGALVPVIIPIFFETKNRLGEDSSWEIMSSLLTKFSIFFIIISVIGCIFSEDMILLVTPGLSYNTLNLAIKLSVLFWPTLFLTIYNIIISSFYQMMEKFVWQAFVPLIGAVVYLGSLFFLLPLIGIYGLASALLINNVVQSIFLTGIFLKTKQLKITLKINKSEWMNILHLFFPFVVSGFFIRVTPLLDRYLGSNLPSGSISHLSYSFKIFSIINLLLSSAFSTVIFPKLSMQFANNDMQLFRSTMSEGLITMFFFIAPIIGIGLILAEPVIMVVLERGLFTHNDTIQVAYLLKLYLFSIIGAALGGITGKALYSFRIARLISVAGVIESIIYIVYTYYLVKYFGIIGVPIGYFIYFTLSIAWASILIRYKTGNKGGRTISLEIFKLAISATTASLILYLLSFVILSPFALITLGGFLGIIVYLISANLLGSTESKKIIDICWSFLKKWRFN